MKLRVVGLVGLVGALVGCGGSSDDASAPDPQASVSAGVATTIGVSGSEPRGGDDGALDAEPPENSAAVTGDSSPMTAAPTTAPAPTTTEMPMPDPAEALEEFVAANGLDTTTGVIEHPCGLVAYSTNSRERQLTGWAGDRWIELDSVAAATDGLDAALSDWWSADVLGDRGEEVVVEFNAPGAMRPFGGVLTASEPDCAWAWAPIVDSCGDYILYDAISVDPARGLIGTGFPAGCSGRDAVRLERRDDLGRLVAAQYEPSQGLCDGYGYRENINLPLVVCEQGWSIEMAQQALADDGYPVDVDGYFGADMRDAVMAYQRARDLSPHGVIAGDTWTAMYPPSGRLYPDFDLDGVASPAEIGHASGATEFGANDYSPPATAVPLEAPYVVDVYCKSIPTGSVSSFFGELIIIQTIQVYSDGTERFAGTRSSWEQSPAWRLC